MPLELVNTVASLLTVTIVAATAIAALIQLGHLRAGNLIHAVISVDDKLSRRDFTDALSRANSELDRALADPAYRAYEISIFRRQPPPAGVSQHHIDMHHAVVLVGNTFEIIGHLVKNRVVDRKMFVEQYCGLTTGAWKVLAHFTALGREATGTDYGWENFEYLAAISQDWMDRNPISYPKGVQRLKVSNPWPIPPGSSR